MTDRLARRARVAAIVAAILGVMAAPGDAATPGAAISAAPAASAPPTTSSGAPLRAPFDVEARRAAIGRPLPDPPRAAALPPLRDLLGVSYYTDAARSVADPALKRRNLAAFAPLRRFVDEVEALADGFMVSRPAQPAYARGAVELLATWAAAGALLGAVNQQGEYEREWTLAGLALAYLKVRGVPGIPPVQDAAVRGWLRGLAGAIQPFYAAARPGRMSSANNHAYWAGLAVAATGIACAEPALFDWGLARARVGIAQVRADGTLRLEQERGALALHYHVFALAPLVMLAELAAANGVALYDEGNRAIRRLAGRVIAGLATPAAWSTPGRVPQEIELPAAAAELAWAEPYVARFGGDARLVAWIRAARPLRDARLGGDLTAAFGGAAVVERP